MMSISKDHAILTKYPTGQIRELREAFNLFDKDEDGSITTEELATVLRNLGQFPSTDELDMMLKEIAIDGDGTFSFEEFVQVMANMGGLSEHSKEDEEKELRRAFTVFDKSGSGYICASDIREILDCLGEDLTEEEIDEMIAEVDIDGDGRIDYQDSDKEDEESEVTRSGETPRGAINTGDTDGRKETVDGTVGACASDKQDESDDIECW